VSNELQLKRAERIAFWLDQRFLDPIIGFLLPGAGDLLTTGFGLYLVVVAVRLRLPVVVIARMLANLGIDMAVGAIPVAGDLFDVAFKANTKNLKLLKERHLAPRASAGDWLAVVGALVVFLAALSLPIIALVWVFRRLTG